MARPRVIPATTTKRKSLYLNLPEEVYADLAEFAEAMEVPLSRFVTLALIENIEAFRGLTQLALEVKAARAGQVGLTVPGLAA